jgi:hypothetical protein
MPVPRGFPKTRKNYAQKVDKHNLYFFPGILFLS